MNKNGEIVDKIEDIATRGTITEPHFWINTVVLLGIYVILIHSIDVIFRKILIKRDNILMRYVKTLLKVVLTIIVLFAFFSQFESFKNISKTLIFGSTVIAATIGFACQRSLEDIVAGFMISMCQPFDIGDRIKLVDKEITGIVKDITIRHTVVKTYNNNRLIIPNSVINKEVIENSSMFDETASNFLDITVSIYNNLDLVKTLIASCVEAHPDVKLDKYSKSIKEDIYTVAIDKDKVKLRLNIWTKDVGKNFKVCSDVRYNLIRLIKEQNIKI